MGVIFDPMLNGLRTTDQKLFDARYVLKSGDTMTGTLNTQKLSPAASWTYDIGDGNNYYASVNVGSGFYVKSINAHVERNTDTRLDVGFYSNEGAGFEIYRFNDATGRAGQFRIIYGGAVGQGEVDYIHFDGTNFPTVFQLDGNGNTVIGDGCNIIFNTGTGTKLGSATNQKLSVWNATPIVQPTTAVTAAAFTANSGTAVNDASTFDGYTLKQVVKALRNIGLLA